MATHDLSRAVWRKSSHSNGQGECVQVASAMGVVAIRDSKNPGGPHIAVLADEWNAFLAAVKTGTLDSER
ncbi:DUF397 domain-containing protein [Actinomadura craniellae]|uniref:DUF397 domain-containing protein n=1 Tax=Actinomadura craniellae TaxID=2231787 RepID=A0A365HCP1_9ACTN|nr:DUF397 domain-containing protein [Actinomadura craniellae]RAY16857.1 DUF397 domain-containing protein [Actinomadura craniellae]